jgi:hypothetical protein
MKNQSPSQISNEQLLKEIGTSRIDMGRRKKLESMIPTLSLSEREELMKLLNEAKASAPAMTEAELRQIQELNAKYEKELNQLMKEAQKTGLKAFEKLEQEGVQGNLTELENELQTVKTANPAQAHAKAPSKTLFKIILILILLAGLSWAGLTYLS